jgi:hypothetical protein
MLAIIGIFYVFYTCEQIYMCRHGTGFYRKHFDVSTAVHLANIFFYFVQWGLRGWAYTHFPVGPSEIDSDAYINYRSYR